MNKELIKAVATENKITVAQVETVLALLQEGNTIPFIARYRKEMTKGLDEEQIQAINKEYQYAVNLMQKKEDVIRLIDEKGLLTEKLKAAIMRATKLVEIDDIYRPFKEKKKTKATEAINNGLEPLAKMIMSQNVSGSLEQLTSKFLNDKVKTPEDALQGAKFIMAEYISDHAMYRSYIRNQTIRYGQISSKKKRNAVDESNTYEMYYEYSEPVNAVKDHRVLALNRAEKEKVINVKIEFQVDRLLTYLESKVIKNSNHFTAEIIKDAIKDSFSRLISPSVEREIRAELKVKAEQSAILMFSENLRNLLMQPPMKDKVVLGLDPAFRTGCKLAIVDESGKFIAKSVCYPHPPQNKYIEAKKIVTDYLNKYPIDIIAIGNGTASRESETFIADVIKDLNKDVFYIIVNEAGASVYSASKEAREEFPHFEVEERSAVSIARRLQDPLAELVKINPKSIGVGQYQHDVTQSKLDNELTFVVETVVNQVGVNVNTASVELLSYISGLSKTIAKNIVNYRNEVGLFTDRKQLKKVPKLGPKSFEQSIGFLRIPDAKNVLDSTSIHPESYKKAKEILNINGLKLTDVHSEKIKELAELNQEELISRIDIDQYTLSDIISSFLAPQRDPRDEMEKPVLKSDILKITDLMPGMKLQGTVRNVVDFGAFVDIGLKNDGLVHISKLSNKFVKHPKDIVSVGEIVEVSILEVDTNRNKVSLSMVE
jgi:uncharacterized protein